MRIPTTIILLCNYSRKYQTLFSQCIYIYTIVSCVWVKTRAICRLPVRSTARCNPGFKLARGSLRSFYERSLWKRASWARDKPVPSYEVCVHMYLHKNARNMNAYTHSRVDARIHTGIKIQTYSRMLQVCDIAYKYTHTHRCGQQIRVCAVPKSRCAKNFRLRLHENVDWSIVMWATHAAETLPLDLSCNGYVGVYPSRLHSWNAVK